LTHKLINSQLCQTR